MTKTSTVQSKDGTERSICESNLKTCESNFKFHEMTKCFVCSGHSSNSLAMPDASSSMRLRHDGNPSIWPACAAFAFLFLVPKILEKFVFSSTKLSTLTFSEPSVNAVDVVRAIAIWYSTFASFQSFSTQKFTARITGRDTKSKICVADFLFGT